MGQLGQESLFNKPRDGILWCGSGDSLFLFGSSAASANAVPVHQHGPALLLPTVTVRATQAIYKLLNVNADGTGTYTLACSNGNQNATCGTVFLRGRSPHNWAVEFSIYTKPGGCFFINAIQFKDTVEPPYKGICY
jgi:hypothetical protein